MTNGFDARIPEKVGPGTSADTATAFAKNCIVPFSSHPQSCHETAKKSRVFAWNFLISWKPRVVELLGQIDTLREEKQDLAGKK